MFRGKTASGDNKGALKGSLIILGVLLAAMMIYFLNWIGIILVLLVLLPLLFTGKKKGGNTDGRINLLLNKAFFIRQMQGLCPAIHMKFVVDIDHMFLDRVDTDIQTGSYLLIY